MRFVDWHYVIALARRPDRLARFRGSAERAGLESWSVFDAIDGVTLAWPHVTRGGRGPGGTMTAGERGCFESHVAVVRDAKARGLGSVAVFEDDVYFAEGAARAWAAMTASLPAQWLILRLWAPTPTARDRRIPAARRPTGRAVRVGPLFGAFAYVLSAAGIDAFLAHPLIARRDLPIDGVHRDLHVADGWAPSWPIACLSVTSSTLSL